MSVRKMATLSASKVMELAKNDEPDWPTTIVERPLDQEHDLGNMIGSECNDLDEIDILLGDDEDAKEAAITLRARDNVQLLFNAIWDLPTEKVDEVIVAKLPAPSTTMPREKPIPVERPPTKWELYAKEKGIVKQKKTKKVWDDVVKEWVPRFGYKKAKAEAEKNWMMEYKEGQDQDPFEKAIEDKRERVAKNELQRLRNIARTQKKAKVPGVGLTPTTPSESQTSDDIKTASELSTKSTASLGKFQQNLPASLAKNVKKPKAKKRHFDPLIGDANVEKANQLKIFNQIALKRPKLDVAKAVGHHMSKEDKAKSDAKKSGSKVKNQGKKGGHKSKGRTGKAGRSKAKGRPSKK